MKKRFLLYLFTVILLSSGATAAIVGGYGLRAVRQVLESQKTALHANIRANLLTFDRTLSLIERQMETRADRALLEVSAEVLDKTGRPKPLSAEDLGEIARDRGLSEVSLVGRDGVVFNSSAPGDVGLNLFGFSPRFQFFMESIYGTGIPKGIRISVSVSTGRLTLFRFYSPPGSEVIVEAWTHVRDFVVATYSESHFEAIFREPFRRLATENPYVQDIDLFVATKRPARAISILNEGEEWRDAALVQTLERQEEVRQKDGDRVTVFTMIPFAEGDLQFANHFISRVVYDFSALNRFGQNVLAATLTSTALITLAVFAFASFRFNRVMLRRFETINRGLERIAGGDYDAPLDVPGADDLARVGANIDAMRERIQRRETSLVESECSLRSIRERLEETVRERTAELIRANASLRRDREALTIQSRELEAARDEAERANRAKTAFLANVSHEVRTPMNAVLGFSEMLLERAGDERDRNLLDAILSSGRTLLALIDDLLDLSKIEAGVLALRLEPVPVGALFGELERMFRPRIEEKEVTLDVMTGSEVPAYLLLDPVRVRQILTNLLSNAIRFTDEGGITVRAFGQLAGANHFDLELEVRDSGIGIPESERERVFEAFHQVNGGNRAGRGGSGLGLAIVRRLVERMGGTATVESAKSGGTRFRMRFPGCEIATPVSRTSRAEPEFTRRFLPADVLIADDMNTNRLLLAKYLESCDLLSLHFAENGETALGMARELKPDLVLMDLQMPRMGGLEAARRIKADPALSDTPVLAVTAHTAPEILEAADSVCDALLIKPIRKAVLFAALAKFLATAPDSDLPTEIPTASAVDPPDEVRYAVPPADRLPPDPWRSLWNHVRDRMVMDEIQRFGEEIRDLGTDRELPGMARWGADLAEQAETFEIERMYRTLDRFPELVQTNEPAEKTDSE